MIPITPPAEVEVDSERRYIAVSDSACRLLDYSRDELLGKKIDEISAPSGAHVSLMFERFLEDSELKGVFALRKRTGEVLWIRYESAVTDGRHIARWTHYELGETDESAL